MSPLDVPLSLAVIGGAAGCFVGFGLFLAVCVLVEKWRGR